MFVYAYMCKFVPACAEDSTTPDQPQTSVKSASNFIFFLVNVRWTKGPLQLRSKSVLSDTIA